MRKFGNVPTEVDGIKFASKKEARRYSELRLLERAGEISDLKVQPRYPFTINGFHIATYVADFAYRDAHGRDVVEDVKGGRATQTDVFRLKAKLFHAIYGREVQVV